MANQLYNMMNNNSALMKRFNDFKQSFRGDPREQVQQLLNSGKITQAQYNRAVMLAQQFQNLMR